MKNRKQKRPSRLVPVLICIPLLAVFCFTAFKWLSDIQSAQREKGAFDSLYAIVEEGRGEQAESPLEEKGVQQTEQTFDSEETHSARDASEQTAGDEAIFGENNAAPEASAKPEPQASSEVIDDVPAVETAESSVEATGQTPTGTTPEAPAVENVIVMREAAEAPVLPQYLRLHEMNEDFFGWISIDESNINYPVMYTPNRPEYYIHRAFDGSESSGGVPFIDGRCVADGNYYLIYGHNMKNGTMFGDLPRYARREFYEDHPIIRYDTLHEEREYRVIAAFYSQIAAGGETGAFRYYDYFDLSDEAVFDDYIREVRKVSLYDADFETKYGDELLVLSTCSYHTANGRFVVVAKRVTTT